VSEPQEAWSLSRSCAAWWRTTRSTPSFSPSPTLFEHSDIARCAFGDDVVEHYPNMATIELAAFESCVTDWERFRGFERL